MLGTAMCRGGIPIAVLTPEEISVRIKAARLLRGVTQDELAAQVREAGLSWRLVGELERGERTMLALHRVALANALGFPERWFTAPLDDLCPEPTETITAQLEHIAQMVQLLIERGGIV